MRKWISWLLIFLIPLILGLGLLRSFLSSDMFMVKEVEVADLGGSEVPAYLRSQLRDLETQLAQVKGQSIWKISMSSLIREVQRRAWVESAAIARQFPDKIRLTFRKKTPLAGIVVDSRHMALVAEDGALYPAAPFQQVPEVVLLGGTELRLSSNLRRRAIMVYREIPEAGLLRRGDVAEIIYTREDGFVLFVAGGNTQILLGEDDFAVKLARVEKVLSYLRSKSIVGRVIDANYQKKVLVRLRKGA